MKIVFDVRSANPHFPGIGRYVRNLGCTLPEALSAGEELVLLYNNTPPPLWLHAEKKLMSTASPFSLAQQWEIPPLLRQAQADVYHSPYYLMPYRPGKPTVLTIHDITPLLYPQTVSLQARLFYRLAHILALRTACRIITGSEAAQQDFVTSFHVPAERIVVIHHGVEAHFSPQPATEIQRVRQKYALPEIFALYVGINKPHKNLPRLVQAWKNVKPGGWALAIGGAWDARYPAAKEQAAGTESILFLGPIPENDLPGLYAASSLFIFPSIYEGFGMPVLEAMACGTPVACASTSSLPEVGGEAVLYFDPLDVEAIGTALRQATSDADLRQALSAGGQEQAKRFSWEAAAQKTVKLYHTIT